MTLEYVKKDQRYHQQKNGLKSAACKQGLTLKKLFQDRFRRDFDAHGYRRINRRKNPLFSV